MRRLPWPFPKNVVSDQLPVCRRPWSWPPPLYTVAFLVLYQKNGVESATQEGGGDLGRDYQHRESLGNADDNTDTPAHFLRILFMIFPLASSSTSLSR